MSTPSNFAESSWFRPRSVAPSGQNVIASTTSTSMAGPRDVIPAPGPTALSVAPLLLAQHEEVEALALLARPRRAPEELQARGDAGIRREAADVHLPAEL